MDRKGTGASTSDSFFFQLFPNYFKVEHGFAKTIKPNTSYRLSIYKGIQKADEMSEMIKGKLVGGKILFDQHPLNFYLPLYTSTRNIEFTVKVLETKPNEQEVQIANCRIKSGDFIKKFKTDGTYYSKEESFLLDNLSLVFELFVHNSKLELDQIIKEYQNKMKTENRNNIANNRVKTPRKNQISSEIQSNSDNFSETSSNGVFASKRKLARKRGHDGRLRSKHGSRQNSEVGSSRSRSSRKSFGPFPHNEKGEHFVHSPKKVSPPKVDEEGSHVQKSPKKENLVTIGRKASELSEIRHRENDGEVTPTKSNKHLSHTERPEISQKSDKYRRSDIAGSVPETLPPRKKEVHDLQIKTSQNMFDIEKKTGKFRRGLENKTEAQAKPAQQTSSLSKNSESKVATKIAETEAIENQPISKPSRENSKQFDKEPEKPNTEKVRVEAPEPSEKGETSMKSKGKAPSIAVAGSRVVNPDEHTSSEIKMKASIRLQSLKNDEETEEAASKEYNGMRDKLFYAIFTVISIILLWNALTPSRKV